jgi:tRNA pseudouridine38-40 synthase
MPRYFAELAYDGTNYCGWQRQNHSVSIQQTIENNISTILREKILITGCGRTDTGVHASQYYFHFDVDTELSEKEQRSIIKIQPKDLSIKRLFLVSDTLHSRYSALTRRYTYYIEKGHNPFNQAYTYQYYAATPLKLEKLNQAASLLLAYNSFFPFCKTGSEVDHYRCNLTKAAWRQEGNQFIFEIQSNRFLRGMVRLVVGMCIMVSEGKIDLEDVRTAMEEQKRLVKDYTSPAQGLFLSQITYPEF